MILTSSFAILSQYDDGLLRNSIVDASCSQIEPKGNPRRILKSTMWHYSLHRTIMTNKTIT